MTTTILAAIEMRKRTRLKGLEVYLASLRRTNPGARLVLFNRSPEHWDLAQLLARYGVEPIDARAFDLQHGIPAYEIEIARFLEYYHWLAANPVGSVILTDILDVFWQGPVPDTSWEGVTVYQENVIAAECPYNSKWLREVWPESATDLAFNQVVCCGVISGRVAGTGIQTYLSAYHSELAKRAKVKRGFDSAVLAGLIQDNPWYFKVQSYLNQDCMHLGYADPITVDYHDGLVRICPDDNTGVYFPAIVHQYNRHAVTEEIYKRWST